MVSTHVSTSGLIWQLGDEAIILSKMSKSIHSSGIKKDYVIVQMPNQMNQPNVNAKQTTLIHNLLYFLKQIFTY